MTFIAKHGMAGTRLYRAWTNMRNRCNRKADKEYKHYGGRGIKVCEEWQNDFETFKEWALSNGYDDTLTLDRIDTNGNYEPNNCRWVTRKEQNNNMTSNVVLTVTHNLTEWSEITGISYSTLQGRIRRGWKTDDVLFKPINKEYSHPKYAEQEPTTRKSCETCIGKSRYVDGMDLCEDCEKCSNFKPKQTIERR